MREDSPSSVTWTETSVTSDTLIQPGLRYRPIIALGHGGMADVLLAVGKGPSGFNKLVVLKTLRKELIADEDVREMFLAEARLSARLNHANVVQVYEVVDSVFPYIVMEYLDGQPLSQILREAGEQFTLPMQLKVISETLTGLHYSHELKDYDGTPLNIVHRDVSPQNVFVTYDGVVKVLDFGIAKGTDSTQQTRAGIVKGKIAYMSREQLLNESVDRRADIYSVGCMLWRIAAGQKLWSKTPEGDVMKALIAGKIPKPSTKRPVEPKLEAIVMKALSPSPEDRYPTARAMRLEIDKYLSDVAPSINLRELGELVTATFSDQQVARKEQIHAALTAPSSVIPPAMPDGLDASQLLSNQSAKLLKVERKNKRFMAVVVLLLVTVVGVTGMLIYVARRGARSNVGESRAPNAQMPARVSIRLNASPSGAILAVDGQPLSGNPATLTIPADSNEHRVTATLAGHESYEKVVRFDQNLSIDIVLQATPTAPGPSTSGSAAASAGLGSPGKLQRKPVTDSKHAKSNCDPPFYFENGIKTYKPDCI